MAFFIKAAGVWESVLWTERIKAGFHSFCGRGEVEILRLGFRDMQKGTSVRAERDVEDLGFGKETDARDVVPPEVGGKKIARVAADGQAGENTAGMQVAQPDLLVVFEMAFLEVESVNEFLARAAAEEAFAVLGKLDAIEGLREGHVGDGPAELEVHDTDEVRAVTAVQDGGVTALRMNRDVDGEIAQLDLFASRAQGPLVGEEDGAVGLLAGEFGVRSSGRGMRSCGGGGRFLRRSRSAANEEPEQDEGGKNDAHFERCLCHSLQEG